MSHFETEAIRINASKSNQREHSAPLYLTSSFTFDSAEEARAMFAEEIQGNIYSRYANPNSSELIEKVCAAEGTESGIATASGMAAMFGSMASLLQQGDHVLASRSLFGSTHQLLTRVFPKWGISSTYGDISDIHNWEKLVQPNTKMLFIETPSNPGLEIIDLEWVGKFAVAHNLILVVDNCFATPYLQQPAKWGAHIVTHSATKYIDGQGRVLGGLILGRKDLINEVQFFTRHTGPSISPFNAWILAKSMETLAVRMDRHCENALHVAEYFQESKDLDFVKYPFLESHPQFSLAKKQMKHGGGIITLTLKGGLSRAQKFIDELQMISVTANLGDSRSIITHPASTTHSKLSEEERAKVGISDGLIRLSVGLEHREDIIKDVERALEKSR
ncbi:trans-sulfuration enzyme family protein [Belliella kenyensis]|uniref:O-succinylhomoserine sulfhydrylase n=1 Tax=Belliella kenyensis TaxID=1472724 RepID=A0ABV8EQP0_9BACT|nr:aminotransferase class I/II-fold pyridoxal phosphate-dependent enzyme [Belliella kenyensis]MCH7403569.1 aminotransferase class I/II-fold pyridoxal phosphate-dependent enzyme [Belliella kenyensis]MDN3603879.1 aminotransferase class I/II-fold pyridoxal phosphate-dependent enzyme [Belliella kenyensis]